MFETLQGVDFFFIVMALSVAVATTIGALIGWHVFGIVRDAHKIVQTAREEGEQVVHEIARAAEKVVEARAATLAESVIDGVKRPRRKSIKKLISG